MRHALKRFNNVTFIVQNLGTDKHEQLYILLALSCNYFMSFPIRYKTLLGQYQLQMYFKAINITKMRPTAEY